MTISKVGLSTPGLPSRKGTEAEEQKAETFHQFMVSWLKVSLGMNSRLPISHMVLEKVMGTMRAEVECTSVGVG